MESSQKTILGQVRIPDDIVQDMQNSVSNIAEFETMAGRYAEQNTTNLLDAVLFGAILLDASDIHLEPEQDHIRLRLRLDGLLRDAASFNQETYRHLLSRIKLESHLKLNITQTPQDGRFTVATQSEPIEVRSSSLPAEYGESVVMRVLNPKNLIGLESLGLRPDLYELFLKEIKKPNGMIAVTGPTGSGKTTSLYAFLLKIQNPEIKIITIEDPIEYRLKGISQTQTDPEKGYSFSKGLESIVRQDPDVILVGEIRDSETAKIALQAALTGHLVLSTIHTNDAAGTVPRLFDLGADVSSIASALKMVVGQRLVRTVCKKCSVLQPPSKEELFALKKGLKSVVKKIPLPDLENVKVARVAEKGCPACNFTGYKGRKGIFEVFLVDSQMERFILSNPPASEIKQHAIKKGMITMYQSGLIEVAQRETTLEEVLRNVEADE